jgi:hypothetical protein
VVELLEVVLVGLACPLLLPLIVEDKEEGKDDTKRKVE